VVFDPEFIDIGHTKAVACHRRWRPGRALVCVLLGLSGCHTLLTGSPVPLWHIERLDRPVSVRTVGEDALVLADGRRFRLPFIKRLPTEAAVFVRALEHGVEVGQEGVVFGLIEPPRICGNDPVVFYRERVNLSELAGLLDPDGIDDSIVHPGAIRSLKETLNRTADRRGMPHDVMGQLRRVRHVYEDSARRSIRPTRISPSLTNPSAGSSRTPTISKVRLAAWLR
jgi:hypothetical protein